MLGFLHSADLHSVWALDLCQRFSAAEVDVLSRLSHHAALPAITAMASDLDAGFFEGLLQSGSDEESGCGSDDGGSQVDTASDAGAVAEAQPCTDLDASGLLTERQAQLETILSAFGLETVAGAVLQAMVATPPAGRQDVSENLAQSLDALAKDYVAYTARKHIADLADQDLDGLAELMRHPMAARVFKNPSALMEENWEQVGDLLAAGLQERARRRLRDDATDCAQEMA